MRCYSHLSLQALNCLVYVVRYTIKVFGLLTAVEAAEPTDHAAADAYRHIWRDIAVKELEECGYIERYQERDASGKLGGAVYNLYEKTKDCKPRHDSPCPENPYPEKPCT